MNESKTFSAPQSALGYIYQVRYALLLALRQIAEVEDPDDCYVSVEKLDDIAFEKVGDPVELLQTKHHARPGNLTDKSEDLWKTIRVWSEFVSAKGPSAESVTFTLLTTESAAIGSIANLIGTTQAERDVDAALSRMRDIAQNGGNQANQSAYDAFLALESWKQDKLIASAYVVTNSPDILGVESLIRRQVRVTASSNQVEAFASRLEGMWFKRIIEVMSESEPGVVCIGELVSMMDDLRTQFLPSNLPSDFDDVEPEGIDIANDDRIFVEQLRLIESPNRVIRNAVVNYYRALEQRSRWSRDNLLKPGEINKYLNRLKSEWDEQCSLLELTADTSTEVAKVESGKKLYVVCQNDCALPIRPDFKSAYVARGSYHDLSDVKEVGWHPDYEARLASSKDKGAA